MVPMYMMAQAEGCKLSIPKSLMTLQSWKSIAQFLGVNQSTALRWHHKFRMAVVRLVGKRVFTTSSAIDDWIRLIDTEQRRIQKEFQGEQPSAPYGAA